MDDPVTCSNNFPNCESGVNQVRVVPASQCACMAVNEARADERSRIAKHMRAVATATIIDPESDGIDGYTGAVLLDMAQTIEDFSEKAMVTCSNDYPNCGSGAHQPIAVLASECRCALADGRA